MIDELKVGMGPALSVTSLQQTAQAKLLKIGAYSVRRGVEKMKKYYITAWKFALAIRERYEHIAAIRYVLVRVEHALFARALRTK